MAARIGLSTGKEWVVEGTADEVVKQIGRSSDPFPFESQGRSVHVFGAHVAYVEEEPASVQEERRNLSVET